MNETRRLISTLKRCLRARGITYRQLARALNLSESSVKRIFAAESFTLSRLERVCTVLEMSVGDLVRLATDGRSSAGDEQLHSLTLEQERTLASDASLLACFYLLLNGRTVGQIEQRLGLTDKALRAVLRRLAAARLLDVVGKEGVNLHATLPIAWRANGPVRQLYERQVRAEFMQSAFTATNESMSFHSAELSAASIRILTRKSERLAADFADLAALDMHAPMREKTSIALLLACRPWVFSMFGAYRSR
jgi:DNA-binding Xre family transcriptional regulator